MLYPFFFLISLNLQQTRIQTRIRKNNKTRILERELVFENVEADDEADNDEIERILW